MSYEGVEEYILENGEYVVTGCWDDIPENAVWWHSIDDTNGFDEEDPSTFNAEKRKSGILIYGNKTITETNMP